MNTERAVRLELIIVEKLIDRRLVREGRVIGLVVQHGLRLVAGQAVLQINEISDEIALARHVDWVYDFALPPLVLHTLYTRNAEALRRWLRIRPTNAVTVLDTQPSNPAYWLVAPLPQWRQKKVKALVAALSGE